MRATARWEDDDVADSRPGRFAWLWSLLRRRPMDSLAIALATFAAGAIIINAMLLQSGPHPAPIFANKPPPAPLAEQSASQALLLPRAKPVEPVANTRPRPEIVADLQRELARRGFYDGAADGVYGPRTDAAIRDFEQTAGMRPSTEPNDTLLAALARSNFKAKPVAAAPNRNDPIAELLAPSQRIIAVQRALADYGYGQIKSTGIYDPETRTAIERFERDRKLPVTGQISGRLARELGTMTGRPLE